MSIQRYDFFGPSNNYPLGGMNESMLGHWVRYTDHVAAVAEAQVQHDLLAKCDRCIESGARGERARIKAAVALLMTMDGDFKRSVFAAIDGEDTA